MIRSTSNSFWIVSLLVLSGTMCSVGFGIESKPNGNLRLDKSNPESPAIYFGDKQLISQYIPESGNKPIFYPLQTVKGHRVIRNYPLSDKYPFETKDHIHHRSFWFAYGSINGLDFWSEEAEDKQGYIVSTNLSAKDSGKAIVLESDWEWQGNDRTAIAHSNQVFAFSVEQGEVHIDATIRLVATAGDLKFGDTKEGAFAVRVGELMKLEADKGGTIINDSGETDDGVWGRSARWVQYDGPAQMQDDAVSDVSSLTTAGITMLVHPNSFSYPGRWHVRGYGLFAHNPFGVNDFHESQDLSDEEKARQGGFVLKAGDEIYLHYLVILHDGALDKTRLEAVWKKFANR